MRMHVGRDDGFAAMQAVAVVAILGAMAAVVVSVVRGPQRFTSTPTCASEVASIRAAAASVHALTDGYPEDASGLMASPANPVSNGALAKWPGASSVDRPDVVTGRQPWFTYTGAPTTYRLGVFGRDLPGIVLDPASTQAQVDAACTPL